MSKYITVVIEYEEDQEIPVFQIGMDLYEGKMTGAMIGDAIDRLEDAEDALNQAVVGRVNN